MALIAALLLICSLLALEPSPARVVVIAEFLEAFPDPSTLGPNGALAALVAMLLGAAGVARKPL